MTAFRPKIAYESAKREEKLGHYRSASQKYAKLGTYLLTQGRKQEARKLLMRAINLSPKSPRLYIQLSLCEASLGHQERAQRSVMMFLRYAIRAKKTKKYQDFVETALKSKPTLLVTYYEGLLEVDRTELRPYLQLAEKYRELERWEEAQSTLVDALKSRLGDEEVIPKLLEVLEARKSVDNVYYLQRYQQGRISLEDLVVLLSERSVSVVRSDFESEEKSLDSLIGNLESELGIELEEKRDRIEPLLAEFRTGAEGVIGKDSRARLDLALAYFEMGLVDVAQEEISRVGRLESCYLEGQMLLGEILFQQGSDLGALETYQKCIRDERITNDMKVEAKYKLVQLYMRLGDIRQAWIIARELSSRAPKYRDLRTLLQQIDERLRVTGT